MQNVQIFGLKNSSATRAAERFFKERRIAIQLINLKEKPMSPGEIRRFVERFGLASLIDVGSKAYTASNLQYLKISDAELLTRIEKDPALLKLPLVRSENLLSIGPDEAAWRKMFETRKV